jgi:hypothetical protein
VTPTDSREWLTPQEAGLKTGFSAEFIRREIAARELPAVWVPSRKGTKFGRWKIHVQHLHSYKVRLGLTS